MLTDVMTNHMQDLWADARQKALKMWGQLRMMRGDYEGAREACIKALELADRLQAREVRGAAFKSGRISGTLATPFTCDVS